MKYLVLGSEGQIGLELVKFLKEAGHTVYEFDIETSSELDLRIRSNTILDSFIAEVDFVFFLAFDVGGSTYLKKYQNTFNFIHNNTLINAFTFECLNKYNKPFIYASSQMSNMQYSPYGVVKSHGETYTRILNGMVVKFWNVYGIENNPEKTHVITDFINSAREKKAIHMRTNGLESRQFLHAYDCSKALKILSDKFNSLEHNKEYHITSFKWNTILDVASIIGDYYNVDIIPSNEVDTVQLDKKNEPDKYILKYWQPSISLEEGITKIIKSYE